MSANNGGGLLSLIVLILLLLAFVSILKGDCKTSKYTDCDTKGNCW